MSNNSFDAINKYNNMEQLKHIVSEFEATVNEFVKTLSLFTQDQLNKVPFKDSWTAGQVGGHILKALHGMPKVISHAPVTKTERAPDEKTAMIDADFLNFNIKMKSPDFIIPEDTTYNKEELINALNDTKRKTVEAAQDKDLSLLSLAFELPVYGHLTLYEAIHFGKVHTQRHIRQLKNIHRAVAGKAEAI
jgi:hypothetical protein